MSYGAWITETAMWRILRVNLNKALNLAIEIMKEEGFDPNIKLGEVFWQGETTGVGKEKRRPRIVLETYFCVSEEVPIIGFVYVYAYSPIPEQYFYAVISRIKDALIQKNWLLAEPIQRPSIMRSKTRASRQ